MRPTLICLSTLLTVASCGTAPEVTGRYADRFTETDIQQVKALVSQRHDIKHTITRISVDRRDQASVESGRLEYAGDVHTTFTVHRRGSVWVIDDSSIQSEKVLVTGQ